MNSTSLSTPRVGDYAPIYGHQFDRRADEIAAAILAAGDPNDLLPTGEVSKLDKLSPTWHSRARTGGYGPPFLKIGNTVRYRRGDLAAWFMARVHKSTAEYDTGGRGRPRTAERCPHCDQALPRHLRAKAG